MSNIHLSRAALEASVPSNVLAVDPLVRAAGGPVSHRTTVVDLLVVSPLLQREQGTAEDSTVIKAIKQPSF